MGRSSEGCPMQIREHELKLHLDSFGSIAAGLSLQSEARTKNTEREGIMAAYMMIRAIVSKPWDSNTKK